MDSLSCGQGRGQTAGRNVRELTGGETRQNGIGITLEVRERMGDRGERLISLRPWTL